MTVVMPSVSGASDSPLQNGTVEKEHQQQPPTEPNEPQTTQLSQDSTTQSSSLVNPQASSTVTSSFSSTNLDAASSKETADHEPLTESHTTVVDIENGQPEFPHSALAKLDEMINRPRWVVPVLPNGELEVILGSVIELCKSGADLQSEACQRFIRDGLTLSFSKILTDEAVRTWKYEIHRCIMKNTERLVELCVVKLSQDWFPLLELLSMALNPNCQFHCYNNTRASESVPAGSQISDSDTYARPPDGRTPKGWLVDLVNRFGNLNGFDILLERFTSGTNLTISVIAAFIKPFGLCYEVLTTHTVQKYFMPLVDLIPKLLNSLTDEELKKESKSEAKNDTLTGIIKALKCLTSRVPNQDEKIKSLEMFRLKMILRLLQISSFNGKMNALNEVNKVICSVSFYTHRHGQFEEDVWLTPTKMAEWIHQNNVLSIVLRDSLHQPQYVEKLDKIIRFMIKEKTLSAEDLNNIWGAQAGKHEAIVKNIHDLLAKLAWDFSPNQLDHLFDCFQKSWINATKKQREKLLELIRRLAEDDKEGVMAQKVLGLLWNLAHSDDVPTDIMDQALTAHIKILDYSCSQDRDAQKMEWINRFVEELKKDSWVLPSLKQIRDICQLFPEAPLNLSHGQRSPNVNYRNNVINQLQTKNSIVMLVAQNLNAYMTKAREFAQQNPTMDASENIPDGRFNHDLQVEERLRFLRFLLKDGQLWLCEPQANQIWKCLADDSIYLSDRENCFRWFSKLMGEEQDLDPDITKEFFENNLLNFDPSLLTENGMKCFERFFKAVNSKEHKLVAKRHGGHLMDDLELIGFDYLWRVVLYSPDTVSEKAIYLLKDIYTNLGPKLLANKVNIHEDFLQMCMDRLKASYDTVSVIEMDADSQERLVQETNRMIRVLTVLKEYVAECDDAHGEERAIVPLGRAFRGKHVMLLVRFPNQGRQLEDVDVFSHTNETVGSLRRLILARTKHASSNLKVELYVNGELLEPREDHRLISEVNIRDKMTLNAKLCPTNSNMPSSPDSSSESSSGTPHNNENDGPNIEAENSLPGVLMSKGKQYASFLFKLADLGSRLSVPKLRVCSRILLKIMPADTSIVSNFKKICREKSSSDLESLFFSSSPSEVLYNLEVVYATLMPALNPLSEESAEFHSDFILSGGVAIILNMLSKKSFLEKADLHSKQSAYLNVLRICKLLLATVSYAHIQVVVDAVQSESTSTSAEVHNSAVILQQALHHIPNPNSDYMIRKSAMSVGSTLAAKAIGTLPDMPIVRSIQRLAWACSCGHLQLAHSTDSEIHSIYETRLGTDRHDGAGEPGQTADRASLVIGQDDAAVCREALELLTLCLALCTDALDTLIKDRGWQAFIIDLQVLCPSRFVRASAMEQFLLMATKCCSAPRPLIFLITLLFTVLPGKAKENANQSLEYFQLLCRLLHYACAQNISLPTAETLLINEVNWLKNIRKNHLQTGSIQVEELLLDGHINITKEVLAFQSPEKKYFYGSQENGSNLVRELIEDFIFSASKMMTSKRHASPDETTFEYTSPICSSPSTITAAFDLLVVLCTGCLQNLKLLTSMIQEMYYTGSEPTLVEWEYLPSIGPRPKDGFVGLKNAGATCYMNSVLQQLFMTNPIRSYLLEVKGVSDDLTDEEFEDKPESESITDLVDYQKDENKMTTSKDDERKDYNRTILKHVQVIFGHLAASSLQYYIPNGFWKHFRLWGEAVNLREQHDALEFFNSLVDSLDEALKASGHPMIISKVLGGSFADQKNCIDCPHRYSREESFTTLNIDIRNQQNLRESLEQYVKGDLLEGANAYHCEKCDKKVNTVKRLCIKKLPPILAIQLKRFDYDWERECAIKFNDYFEFPREFDMEPYTAKGLAKLEGDMAAIDSGDEETESSSCTQYRLVGMVVHSGQASGGHYYSYILHRSTKSAPAWYKFDDGEVSECKMEDDEEMKNQCFGGEYLGEVFDNMIKRMSYRRQKRWWNAYILFYERVDVYDDENIVMLSNQIKNLNFSHRLEQTEMPESIYQRVCKQNIQFMHNKNQYSLEYFHFMRKLLITNQSYLTPPHGMELSPEAEEIAMNSIQLASKFLFSVGFHAKKNLRGAANDWYDALTVPLRHSKRVRAWFAQNILFAHHTRFSEYLLECPSSEIRNAFMKILVFLAHFSLPDGPFAAPNIAGQTLSDSDATLGDHILSFILNLLHKEVPENGRHLTQYFHLFLMYANLGPKEKFQLLKLNVPTIFINVAIDEGPGPPIKYQYAELGKLYSVVSQLIRCCDVSTQCQSSVSNQNPKPNPHGDESINEPLMPIQPQVSKHIFCRNSYLKKLIEDCNNSDETAKLMRFCSWENPHFSAAVLSELLWQISYSYTYELKPYLDLLLHLLLLDDSWKNHRIHNALKGIPNERDGLFDTIQRSKNHYQKRAYQCIKMLVSLFSRCPAANQMLQTIGDWKKKWTSAVEWLHDELERRHYPAQNAQYGYNNWSPQAQSNETSNGYFLERSQSAQITLAKACELCPDEDVEAECRDECPENSMKVTESRLPSSQLENQSLVDPSSADCKIMEVASLDYSPGSPSHKSTNSSPELGLQQIFTDVPTKQPIKPDEEEAEEDWDLESTLMQAQKETENKEDKPFLDNVKLTL